MQHAADDRWDVRWEKNRMRASTPPADAPMTMTSRTRPLELSVPDFPRLNGLESDIRSIYDVRAGDDISDGHALRL